MATKSSPLHVAMTGSSGNIGYASAFRIARGDIFGSEQPVVLHLYDLPQSMQAMRGIAMELEDIASPLLRDVVVTDDLHTAFRDADLVLLAGSAPQQPGMERVELLAKNARIFIVEGKALAAVAKQTTRVVVVGNPDNTNCAILARHARGIPRENFSALSRLDHDRGLSMLARKLGCSVTQLERFAVWGNHSPTMFPDVAHLRVAGRPVAPPAQWVRDTFVPDVQGRAARVLEARGASSAGSAANALLAHCRDWYAGTGGGWVSMIVESAGEYGVEEGLFCSFPVTVENGRWRIVQGLALSDEAKERIRATTDDLIKEREEAKEFLL